MKTFMISAAAIISIGALPAKAHVSLEQRESRIGKPYKAVLKVPHGCDGEPTTAVKVELPEGFIGAKPMPKAGWKTEIERGDYGASYAHFHGAVLKEGVKSITWSGGTLSDDFYDEFVVNGFVARELHPGPVYFKVVQTCAKGELSWSEIPADGVDPHSLKFPAARLLLVAAAEAADHDHHGANHQTSAVHSGPLAIENAWARATPQGAKIGAAYLTIRNTGTEPDTLVGVDADFAQSTEIHDMEMKDGVMRMRAVTDGLSIPAGGTVELKPGGLHIMFHGLKAPLKAGETTKAKLKFKSGQEVEVEFSVAPIGAEKDDHSHHH